MSILLSLLCLYSFSFSSSFSFQQYLEGETFLGIHQGKLYAFPSSCMKWFHSFNYMQTLRISGPRSFLWCICPPAKAFHVVTGPQKIKSNVAMTDSLELLIYIGPCTASKTSGQDGRREYFVKLIEIK